MVIPAHTQFIIEKVVAEDHPFVWTYNIPYAKFDPDFSPNFEPESGEGPVEVTEFFVEDYVDDQWLLRPNKLIEPCDN
jgi:hypothetical protein